jgi:hypothetical protein
MVFLFTYIWYQHNEMDPEPFNMRFQYRIWKDQNNANWYQFVKNILCHSVSNMLQLCAHYECSRHLICIPSSGKVSIADSCFWIEPKTDSKEEEEAAERVRQNNVSSCWV